MANKSLNYPGLHHISQFFLNDNVINDYLKLIAARYPDVYVFDSYFFFDLCKKGYDIMKKWTKRVDIFSKRLLIVPINIIEIKHWVMICVDVNKKHVIYYDSIQNLGDAKSCLSLVFTFLKHEHHNRKGIPLPVAEWRTLEHKDIPKQQNLYDCGVFLCTYTEYLARGAPFNFSQNHMSSFRQLIAYELTLKRLIDLNDRLRILEFISTESADDDE